MVASKTMFMSVKFPSLYQVCYFVLKAAGQHRI